MPLYTWWMACASAPAELPTDSGDPPTTTCADGTPIRHVADPVAAARGEAWLTGGGVGDAMIPALALRNLWVVWGGGPLGDGDDHRTRTARVVSQAPTSSSATAAMGAVHCWIRRPHAAVAKVAPVRRLTATTPRPTRTNRRTSRSTRTNRWLTTPSNTIQST
ncbi:MAG: hypothetical protein ABMA64_01925, partial [Myxococcota bacterium]